MNTTSAHAKNGLSSQRDLEWFDMGRKDLVYNLVAIVMMPVGVQVRYTSSGPREGHVGQFAKGEIRCFLNESSETTVNNFLRMRLQVGCNPWIKD